MRASRRYLVGAAVGLLAAPILGYLVVNGIQRSHFLVMEMLISHQACCVFAALPGPGSGGSIVACLFWTAAAVLFGLLASMRRISPSAPLAAALIFVLLEAPVLLGRAGLRGFVWELRHAPAGLQNGLQAALLSGLFLMIGGALAVAAAAPWRWRGSPAPPASPNRHPLGLLIGLVTIPVLWAVLPSYDGMLLPIRFHYYFTDIGWLIILAGAAVVGMLCAARSVSPLAALVAGAPLFATGVFTLFAPSAAQRVIDAVVYGTYWQPAAEDLAASGLLVLVGGMLLVAGAMPYRWRRPVARRADRSATPWPGSELTPDLSA